MKKDHIHRRDLLRMGGTLALGAPFMHTKPEKPDSMEIFYARDARHRRPEQPVTAIVLGAGNRGNVYASYALKFPDELRIVGVAEPVPERRERFSAKYNIPRENQFVTWEHVLERAPFADVLIITTPDHLHYGPAVGGLPLGYDLILEKAIAQSWKECRHIQKLAGRHSRIVGVCHVLRYTDYFRKLRETIRSGILGDLVSVQHLEPVEHVHMSHSFVRGNWRNTGESNPMLLSKSCHDTDILLWLIGKHCTRVSSFGSLKHFRKENAPEGSTPRCTDGCRVEETCPYSALRIYHRNLTWLHHFDLPEKGDKRPAVLEALRTGPYGRCVYRCDNDVVDHQVVIMEFEDSVTAAFSMEAFTSYAGRRTRLMGTMGDAVGDEQTLTVTDFRTGKQTAWNVKDETHADSGHGGGDYSLVRDFIQAVSQRDPELLSSTIGASMESHLIGFKAEKSRLTGKTGKIRVPQTGPGE